MNEQQIIELEKIIGYEFKDKNLLIQSFTRKSYSNEHKDIKNNECLEFIGDEAIDVIVAKNYVRNSELIKMVSHSILLMKAL